MPGEFRPLPGVVCPITVIARIPRRMQKNGSHRHFRQKRHLRQMRNRWNKPHFPGKRHFPNKPHSFSQAAAAGATIGCKICLTGRVRPLAEPIGEPVAAGEPICGRSHTAPAAPGPLRQGARDRHGRGDRQLRGPRSQSGLVRPPASTPGHQQPIRFAGRARGGGPPGAGVACAARPAAPKSGTTANSVILRTIHIR